MSGPESFSAPESVNQGSSAETYRLFQERMKVASAQIQAIRAGEQKQKKKEDELIKILTDFIKSTQTSSHDDLLIEYLTKLLAINLPAVFIIALIIINYPDLQEKSGIKLIDFSSTDHSAVRENPTLPDLYFKNATLPLQVKIAIDSWMTEISKAAASQSHKVLDHALRLDGKAKSEVIDLANYSLSAYLESKDLDFDPDFARQFVDFCLNGILSELAKPKTSLDYPR
jgi:hypothetical protein